MGVGVGVGVGVGGGVTIISLLWQTVHQAAWRHHQGIGVGLCLGSTQQGGMDLAELLTNQAAFGPLRGQLDTFDFVEGIWSGIGQGP